MYFPGINENGDAALPVSLIMASNKLKMLAASLVSLSWSPKLRQWQQHQDNAWIGGVVETSEAQLEFQQFTTTLKETLSKKLNYQ